MKTLELEIAVMKSFDFKRNIIIPNITANNGVLGFETDMLIISKNGYAHGLELKVSKSDLKNDLKKNHWISVAVDEAKAINLYFKKLKYFSYAIPKELTDEVMRQVPLFCGIYEVSKGVDFFENEYTSVREIRKPKTLNSYKFTDKELLKISHLGCMRAFTLKQNINKLTNKEK